jgi:hypothetical protein
MKSLVAVPNDRCVRAESVDSVASTAQMIAKTVLSSRTLTRCGRLERSGLRHRYHVCWRPLSVKCGLDEGCAQWIGSSWSFGSVVIGER